MAVNAQTSPWTGRAGRLQAGPVATQRPLPKAPRDAQPAVPPRPRELRNAVALLFAILLISVISLLYMNQAGRLATSGYQISHLQAQRDQLQRDNQALEVELAHLHALPYIEQQATTRLQMTKGELARVQYVNLNQQQLDLASRPDGTGGSQPAVPMAQAPTQARNS